MRVGRWFTPEGGVGECMPMIDQNFVLTNLVSLLCNTTNGGGGGGGIEEGLLT